MFSDKSFITFGQMSKSNSRFLAFIAGFLLIFLFFSNFSYSQGNLLITPRRVVFDGSRRVMELNLVNTGRDTAKYNVSLIQYRMNEDGSFTEIDAPDPGQRFADKYIRFFPRTVSLGPNEAQVVKMQVINTDKLEPGEYRSHVYFRSVPNLTALGEENSKVDSNTVSIKLIPVFGITIPVIIRVGENDTKVSINDLKYVSVNDTTKRLEFTFNRVGKMSIYGDIKVSHISNSGKETNVGSINGVAIYTPNSKRRQWVDLNQLKGVNFNEGKLKVLFISQSDSKPTIYAEAELVLN